MPGNPSSDGDIWISDWEHPQPHIVINLQKAIDAAVTVAMSLKGEENEELRGDVVRGLAGLAEAELLLGIDKHPELRFPYVALLAGSSRHGNTAAGEVMEALSQEQRLDHDVR